MNQANPNVHVCMTAPSNMKQFEEYIDAVRWVPLSVEDMDFMRRFGDAVHHRNKWFMGTRPAHMMPENPDLREINTLGLSQEGINAIIEYQHLEQRVRRLSSRICRPFCRTCSDRCCNKEYCSESIESFWLRLLWGLWGHCISEYDFSEGWLSPAGCRLEVGRPPVCYEFLCSKILTEIQERTILENLKGASELVSLTGRNALGNRHLITLSREQILERINFRRIRRQIGKAQGSIHRYETALAPFNLRTITFKRILEVGTKKEQPPIT